VGSANGRPERDPRHADIPDAEVRDLAAWFFVTMRRWSSTELVELSTADAEKCIPRKWLAAMQPEAPLTGGAMVGGDAREARKVAARRAVRAHLPNVPPPTWLRGADGRLYPARRRTVTSLAARLVELLPGASNRAIARLVGCSHGTVAECRRLHDEESGR